MRASINGYTLTHGGEVSWTSKPGFDPVVKSFVVSSSIVNRLREKRDEITLRVGDREIKNLILIGDGPADGARFNERAFSSVTLADRRFLLTTKGLSVAFNIRRRTGATTVAQRTSSTTQVPEQLLSSIPEEEFYPMTLLDGKPWTVLEALKFLADEASFLIKNLDTGFPDGDVFTAQGYRGQGALSLLMAELLALVPFWEFSVDDEGVGYFYRQVDFANPDLTTTRMTNVLRKGQVWGAGVWGKTSLSKLRPRGIKLHFPVEVELYGKFDSERDQELGFQNAAPLVPGYAPPFELESFIINPVDNLPNPGSPSQSIAKGSLVNLHVFLAALRDASKSGLIPLPVGAANSHGPLTVQFLNKYYLSPVVMFGVYTLGERGLTNTLYHRIVTEVRRSYRQNFRFTNHWAKSVYSFSEYRIDYLDPVSATRRRTNVFCPFTARINEQAGPLRRREDVSDHWFVGNERFSSVEADGFEDIAPADVVIFDQEAKAFQVVFRRGQYGDVEDYIPGTIAVPSVYLNATNLKKEMDHEAPIADDFQLGTVLTCTPVPRHTGTHLFTVTVTAQEAARHAAASMKVPSADFGPCTGPELDIFVPYDPQMTAKFGYQGLSKQDELAAPFFDPRAKFPASRLSNKDIIEDIAKSYAVSYFYRYLDHYSGTATVPNSGQETSLIGSISGVTSTPTLNTYHLSQDVTAADMMNFLTSSTREMLQRRLK